MEIKNSEQFEKLADIILWWNERINVTAHRDRDSFMKKNVEDSLSALDLKEFKNAKRVLDLGTGGGFPGLPLAIACPDKEFILLDSVEKKLKVVATAANELGLNNVEIVKTRAEDLAKLPDYRESFDVVVSRAVANMSTLSEYCLPFVKVGGSFIAYKTASSVVSEISSAEGAIKALGGGDIKIAPSENDDDDHILVIVDKVKQTPKKYPRKAGLPSKQPL